MNLGANVKKVATNFNLGWRIYKFTIGIKPVCAGVLLDIPKHEDKQLLNKTVNLLSLKEIQTEKISYTFPQTDSVIKKSIIDPEESLKISFQLPIKNSKDVELVLPFHIAKEIKEPEKVIDKSAATHICRIRKKKMRKHKLKKFQKKHKAEIMKKRIRTFIQKEAVFEQSLKEVLSEIDTFSAEEYVNQTLEDAHWEKPVTRVRGFLAPQWVIKEHLKKEKERKLMRERIEAILNT